MTNSSQDPVPSIKDSFENENISDQVPLRSSSRRTRSSRRGSRLDSAYSNTQSITSRNEQDSFDFIPEMKVSTISNFPNIQDADNSNPEIEDPQISSTNPDSTQNQIIDNEINPISKADETTETTKSPQTDSDTSVELDPFFVTKPVPKLNQERPQDAPFEFKVNDVENVKKLNVPTSLDIHRVQSLVGKEIDDEIISTEPAVQQLEPLDVTWLMKLPITMVGKINQISHDLNQAFKGLQETQKALLKKADSQTVCDSINTKADLSVVLKEILNAAENLENVKTFLQNKINVSDNHWEEVTQYLNSERKLHWDRMNGMEKTRNLLIQEKSAEIFSNIAMLKVYLEDSINQTSITAKDNNETVERRLASFENVTKRWEQNVDMELESINSRLTVQTDLGIKLVDSRDNHEKRLGKSEDRLRRLVNNVENVFMPETMRRYQTTDKTLTEIKNQRESDHRMYQKVLNDNKSDTERKLDSLTKSLHKSTRKDLLLQLDTFSKTWLDQRWKPVCKRQDDQKQMLDDQENTLAKLLNRVNEMNRIADSRWETMGKRLTKLEENQKRLLNWQEKTQYWQNAVDSRIKGLEHDSFNTVENLVTASQTQTHKNALSGVVGDVSSRNATNSSFSSTSQPKNNFRKGKRK